MEIRPAAPLPSNLNRRLFPYPLGGWPAPRGALGSMVRGAHFPYPCSARAGIPTRPRTVVVSGIFVSSRNPCRKEIFDARPVRSPQRATVGAVVPRRALGALDSAYPPCFRHPESHRRHRRGQLAERAGLLGRLAAGLRRHPSSFRCSGQRLAGDVRRPGRRL